MNDNIDNTQDIKFLSPEVDEAFRRTMESSVAAANPQQLLTTLSISDVDFAILADTFLDIMEQQPVPSTEENKNYSLFNVVILSILAGYNLSQIHARVGKKEIQI